MIEALKPCPFCGKTDTLRIITAQQLAEEDADYDGEFWENSDSWAAICDAHKPGGPGGCGASGGFFPSEAEAIAAWNQRAAIDAALAQADSCAGCGAPAGEQHMPNCPLSPTMCDQFVGAIAQIWLAHPDYGIRQTLDALNAMFPVEPAQAVDVNETASGERQAILSVQDSRQGALAQANAPADERKAFEAWCAVNGHGTIDDMMMPLDRSLKRLLWSAWKARAASAPAAPEWQPIETAPKDKTRVLCVWKCARGQMVYEGWCQGVGTARDGGDVWRSHSLVPVSGRPTHWMPMPTTPKEQQP